MLKSQDVIVVFKVLSYEESDKSSLNLTRELQGQAWLHVNQPTEKISKYDMETDELVVDGELDDFAKAELEAIDEFIYGGSAYSNHDWTYRTLAKQLFISVSEANNSVKRCLAAGLLFRIGNGPILVNRPVFCNYIQYGVGISFYAERGRIVRGIPTSYAAPVFKDIFASSEATPPVWPCARGTHRGVAIQPLYKSVSKAVMIDSWLYTQLALVDIFRIGTAREKEQAMPFLEQLRGKK